MEELNPVFLLLRPMVQCSLLLQMPPKISSSSHSWQFRNKAHGSCYKKKHFSVKTSNKWLGLMWDKQAPRWEKSIMCAYTGTYEKEKWLFCFRENSWGRLREGPHWTACILWPFQKGWMSAKVKKMECFVCLDLRVISSVNKCSFTWWLIRYESTDCSLMFTVVVKLF